MRLLFAAIGYLCTATVLTGLLGVGYMWQNDRLDDEKVFRVIALMHDIDPDAVAEEEVDTESEVPPEEPSLADLERARAVVARDYEVKMAALKQSRFEFDGAYTRLDEKINRFEELTGEVERQLRQQGELSSKEAVSKVVRDLVAVQPDTAKDELLNILAEPGGMEDVIMLMDAMPTGSLNEILDSFRTDEEKAKFHQIQMARLQRGEKTEALRDVIEKAKRADVN